MAGTFSFDVVSDFDRQELVNAVDQTPREAAGMTYRQVVTLRKGIPEDLARKISKQIRDKFPKVQVQTQGDALRVMAKAKDDLQAVIRFLREHEAEYPVP